ncbi:MAG: hypothetical protein ABI348_05870 [Nitrososphaera sp.]|jgi:hypothetical protein
MVYVYRCLGCLAVFSSQKNAQLHDNKCKLAGYFAVTLDEFLKGRKT